MSGGRLPLELVSLARLGEWCTQLGDGVNISVWFCYAGKFIVRFWIAGSHLCMFCVFLCVSVSVCKASLL